MEKIWGGVGENTHMLEKNAKMLEKINTIITSTAFSHMHAENTVLSLFLQDKWASMDF